MRNYEPVLRKAERQAVCRACDKLIDRGENMISWFSDRNHGMYIHLCLECCEKIGKLSKVTENESRINRI